MTATIMIKTRPPVTSANKPGGTDLWGISLGGKAFDGQRDPGMKLRQKSFFCIGSTKQREDSIMARLLVLLMTTVALLLHGVEFSGAAQRTLNANTPKGKAAISAQGKAADLTVQSAAWSKPPKEGDSVGGTTILNILVANKGNAPANANAMKIACTALTNNHCPVSLNGIINIPALGPGKSTMISWPPLSSEKWASGRFRLNIQADTQNRIKESDEKNNAAQIGFTVLPNPQMKIGGMQPSARGISKKRLPLSAAQLSAQIHPLNIKLTASKIRTQFPTYGVSLFWSMDIINKGTDAIPADAMEYTVSQTLNSGNSVTMTKGNIHQALAVNQSFELKGDFEVCCAYDGMVVEIRNRINGQVLATVGAPLPVEPLRAKVQVTDATFRLTPKPAAPLVTFTNHAAMPVKVKAVLYRNPPDAASDYILADERQFWISANDSTTNNYTGKLGAFDKFRIEITQVCPVIMCSKTLCLEFPTFEGNFVGQ